LSLEPLVKRSSFSARDQAINHDVVEEVGEMPTLGAAIYAASLRRQINEKIRIGKGTRRKRRAGCGSVQHLLGELMGSR
jgi:hypothetical protein